MSDFLDKKPVRGCLGASGFAIAGFSLAFLAIGIGQAIQAPASEMPGHVGVSVCTLVTGGLGAALLWYGWLGVFGDGSIDDRVEEHILELAREHDGRVTVPEIAAETELSLDEADAMMDRLARDGHAQLDVDSSGDEVYSFPGLGPDAQTAIDDQSFQARLEEARREEAVEEDS